MTNQAKLFTLKGGKGGEYEYLGVATGKGTCKGAPPFMVYRDTKTGSIYYREPENFNFRMQPVATGDVV